jgi:hypothetical protein
MQCTPHDDTAGEITVTTVEALIAWPDSKIEASIEVSIFCGSQKSVKPRSTKDAAHIVRYIMPRIHG